MTFTHPLALLALLALPALVAVWIGLERRRRAGALRFASPALLPGLVERAPGRLRLVPAALLLLGLAALLVGIARPHARLTVPRKDATVVLAIDTSRSMGADDVPPTRLDAAVSTADRFLSELPERFSVGLVAFGSRAYVAVPPTRDRELVRHGLSELRTGEGTAIGDAVLLAARLAQRQKEIDGIVPPAAVLVISDGARDGGRTAPLAAARRASALHTPVSTVLVGTSSGVVDVKLVGGYTERIRVPASPATLRQIARASGGAFYRARSAAALAGVYRQLATRLGHTTSDREITDLFAAGAIVLLLGGAALSTAWFRRVVP
ncbi:MAG: VWA domain-containing protein [Thermoleophilia bacterium]|nr:VWA domain-containing protein [Thermoleophilia bacterium]